MSERNQGVLSGINGMIAGRRIEKDSAKMAASLLLMTVLAVMIYSNTFDAPFHFDDSHAIVENYAIHRFDVREILASSTRPVLDLTFALNYALGRLDVTGYHVVNLLLHIANGAMLYFILFWTLNIWEARRSGLLDRFSTAALKGLPSKNLRVPLYAGLIFLAHPVQTQAVTYIVSRSSVLATFFYLLTFLLVIRGFASGAAEGARRSVGYFAGAFIASCLGMGTKQEAATLPFMVLLYDMFFVSAGDWKGLKNHAVVHLALFMSLGVVVYLSWGLQSYVAFDYAKGIPVMQGDPLTSYNYFLTQLHVIPFYIKLLFFPINLNLDYDWPITRSIDPSTVFFFVFLLSLLAFAVVLFRRARVVSFAVFWFFVTLSVTSSFIVIYDVIFEHRLYLPSIGFATCMAVLISSLPRLISPGGVR